MSTYILILQWAKRWAFAILLMAAIFCFSSIPGEQVGNADQSVSNKIDAVMPMIRQVNIDWLKVGHMIGYAGLGLAFRHAFYASFRQRKEFWVAVAACAIYAISDEVHQAFIPGRSPQITDVCLDTLAATGMLAFQAWLLKKSKPQTENRENS